MLEITDSEEKIRMSIDGSILILRRMTPDRWSESRARHTIQFKNREGEWKEKIDDDAVLMDVVDYAIVSWENVLHPVTKTQVPCTSENKRCLPLPAINKIGGFLAEAIQASYGEMEKDLKNLNGSSG